MMNFEQIFAHAVRRMEQISREAEKSREENSARRAAYAERKAVQQEQQAQEQQPPQQEEHQPAEKEKENNPTSAAAAAAPVVDLAKLAAQQTRKEWNAVTDAAHQEVQKQQAGPDQNQKQNDPSAAAIVDSFDLFEQLVQDASNQQQQRKQQNRQNQQQSGQPQPQDPQPQGNHNDDDDDNYIAAFNRPYLLGWTREVLEALIFGTRFSDHPVYVLPVSCAVAHSGIQCDSAMAVHSAPMRVAILCGTGSVIVSPEITEQTRGEVTGAVAQLLASRAHHRHGIYSFRIADFFRHTLAACNTDYIEEVPPSAAAGAAGGASPIFDISVAVSLLQNAGHDDVTARAIARDGGRSSIDSVCCSLAPQALPSLVRLLFPAQFVQQRTVASLDDDAQDLFGTAADQQQQTAPAPGGKKTKKKKNAAQLRQEQQQRREDFSAALDSFGANPLQVGEQLVENDIFITCMAEARAIFCSQAHSEPALRAGAVAVPPPGIFPTVETAFIFRAAADRVAALCRSAGLGFAVQLNTGSEMCCALMEHHGFVVKLETLRRIEGGLLARGEYLGRRAKEAADGLKLFVGLFKQQQQQAAASTVAVDGQQKEKQQSDDGGDQSPPEPPREDFWNAATAVAAAAQAEGKDSSFSGLRVTSLPQLWQKTLVPALEACGAAEQRIRNLKQEQAQQQPQQAQQNASCTASPLYDAVLHCIEQQQHLGTGQGGSTSRDSIAAISQRKELQEAALRMVGFSSTSDMAAANDGRRQQRRDDDDDGGGAQQQIQQMPEAERLRLQLEGACCLIFICCRAAIDRNSLFYEMRPCRGLKESLQMIRKAKKDGDLIKEDGDGECQGEYADAAAQQHQQQQHPQVPALIEPVREFEEYAEIHSHFTGLRSETGRIFSTGPNLQTLPRKSKAQIREALVAPPGTVLVSLDYSQFELRVLAHLSGDSNLIAALRAQRDVLGEITAELLGVQQQQQEQQKAAPKPAAKKAGGKKAKKVTATAAAAAAAAAAADQPSSQNDETGAAFQPGTPAFSAARDAVKIMTYGLLFGMGEAAVAELVSGLITEFANNNASNNSNNIQQQQQQVVSRLKQRLSDRNKVGALFFVRFPGVRSWIDSVCASARIHGSVRTLSGMCRDLSDEVEAASKNVRRLGDPMSVVNRQAVATAVQGTAADIIKMAMCLVQSCRGLAAEEMATANTHQVFRPFATLLPIHDELVFAVDARDGQRMERTVAELAGTMQRAGDVLMQLLAAPGERALPFAVPLQVKMTRGPTFGF